MRDNKRLAVALTKCYFCGESGDIVIGKQFVSGPDKSMVEKMDGHVLNMEPCSKCTELMKKGIILITIDNAKSEPGWDKPKPMVMKKSWDRQYEVPGIPNPYRTGGWFVVTEDYLRRAFDNVPEMVEWAAKHRFLFVEHEAAELMGLFKAVPTESR